MHRANRTVPPSGPSDRDTAVYAAAFAAGDTSAGLALIGPVLAAAWRRRRELAWMRRALAADAFHGDGRQDTVPRRSS